MAADPKKAAAPAPVPTLAGAENDAKTTILEMPPEASPEFAMPFEASPEFAMPFEASPEFAMPFEASPEFAMPPEASPEFAMPPEASPEFATPPEASPEFVSPLAEALPEFSPPAALPEFPMPAAAPEFSSAPPTFSTALPEGASPVPVDPSAEVSAAPETAFAAMSESAVSAAPASESFVMAAAAPEAAGASQAYADAMAATSVSDAPAAFEQGDAGAASSLADDGHGDPILAPKPKGPPLTFKQRLRKYAVDSLLALGAAAGFGVFGFRSVIFSLNDGFNAPVAHMGEGVAEVKASGQTEYTAVNLGEALRNLDTVWVGRGHKAVLKLEDGSTLELDPQTLVLLKRPFRSGGLLRDKIRVLKGKATGFAAGSKIPEILEVKNKPVEQPDEKLADQKTELSPQDAARTAPVPGTVLFLRNGTSSEIAFSWPRVKTGFLVISQGQGENTRVQYLPVKNVRDQKVRLEASGLYYWQVIDENKNPVVGPYRFALKPFDQNEIKRLILEGGDSGTQVIWQ